MKSTRRVLLVAALLCLAATGVQAKRRYMEGFRAFYQIKPGSDLYRMECRVCHTHPVGGPGWNAYGQALRKLREQGEFKSWARKPQEFGFQKAEKLDSDGDSFRNGDEIRAGTLPGDPNSHP